MSDQIIPLTSDPNQILKTGVTVNGAVINLQLDIRYNDIAEYWVMRITNTETDTVLVDSLPMVSGDYPAGNILGQYAHLGIGAAYIVKAGDTSLDYPDDSTLGTDFYLVWGDA